MEPLGNNPVPWRSGRTVAWVVLALLLAAGGLLARHIYSSALPKEQLACTVIRPPHETNALALNGGVLWAGGMEGVQGLDPATGAVIRSAPCGQKFELVKALQVDAEGVLWIGHQNGLTRFDGKQCATLTTANGLPDNRVVALYQDRRGALWVGTWGGAVKRLEGGGWQKFTRADGLVVDMVNVILEDRRGAMWFGSNAVRDGGISILHEGRRQYFTPANGLPHSHVTSLVEDTDGNVWAGTGFYDRGGLVRFRCDGGACAIQQVITQRDGLAGAKVRSLFQDRSGALWAGSEYDGIARRSAGRWQVYKTENGLSDNEVVAMIEDSEGNLWMGTKDGVTKVRAAALASAP